jgi:peptidyl-prolyl cis-trans isomerase B (cyclophilin B)
MARPFAFLLCLVALVAVSCGDDDDDSAGSSEAAAKPKKEGQACREVAQPEPKPDGGAMKPSRPLDPAKTFRVLLQTNCGDITIRLDQKSSPKTAASFAWLARTGFYDDTVFHRVVPGFVIQGGDPTGSGMGGPGYSVREKPSADTVYTEGVVAMAKTEVEPAGTSGSQFFIVTAPDAGLPPDYAVAGEVVEGMGVAREIDKLGDPAGRPAPTQVVLVEKASLDVS